MVMRRSPLDPSWVRAVTNWWPQVGHEAIHTPPSRCGAGSGATACPESTVQGPGDGRGGLGRLGVQRQQQDQAPQADREQEQAEEELKAQERQLLRSLHEDLQAVQGSIT